MTDKVIGNDIECLDDFQSSIGDKFYTPIEYEYSQEHKCFIPVSGKKINRYEMIQASKGSCDINYIVKRALAGDNTALNVRVPSYADVSEVPDNLNDLNNMNLEAINSFAKLDPNLRSLFDNDVDKFISSINDGTYIDVINKALNVKTDNTKEEVTE